MTVLRAYRTQRTHHRTHDARMQAIDSKCLERNARTLVHALRARRMHVHPRSVDMMCLARIGVRALRALRALPVFMRVCMRAPMRAVASKCVRSRARALSFSFF